MPNRPWVEPLNGKEDTEQQPCRKGVTTSQRLITDAFVMAIMLRHFSTNRKLIVPALFSFLQHIFVSSYLHKNLLMLDYSKHTLFSVVHIDQAAGNSLLHKRPEMLFSSSSSCVSIGAVFFFF